MCIHLIVDNIYSCVFGVFLPSEKCDLDCGPNGNCQSDRCVCNEGWTGFKCEQRLCDRRCLDHGQCNNGTCFCHQGWNGKLCTLGKFIMLIILILSWILTLIFHQFWYVQRDVHEIVTIVVLVLNKMVNTFAHVMLIGMETIVPSLWKKNVEIKLTMTTVSYLILIWFDPFTKFRKFLSLETYLLCVVLFSPFDFKLILESCFPWFSWKLRRKKNLSSWNIFISYLGSFWRNLKNKQVSRF